MNERKKSKAGSNMDALTIIVLVILIFFTSGIIFGWLIARYFYLQASEGIERSCAELKEEAIRLRIYNTMTLTALENTGVVELIRDDSGDVTGLKRIIKSPASKVGFTSDDVPNVVYPPIDGQ